MQRVYAVRPFWGWKRALQDAGLDYSNINVEVLNYVDCKVCGRDLGSLPYHLLHNHQRTGEDYRREYPGAEMVSEVARSKVAQSKVRHEAPFAHWEAVWTPEYVLDRMVELHRRKFPLNFKWINRHEKALGGKAIQFFGSWDKALRRIDLDPAHIRLFRPTWRGKSPWRGVGKAAILAELRRREAAGAPLTWKTILPTEHGSALLERARKLFGSWSAALAAAGLDPFSGAISPWAEAGKATLLKEIRRRKRAGESLRSGTVWCEKWGQPLVRRAGHLFGSWNAALTAAGFEPEGGYSQWAAADKVTILREIRRRKRAQETLRSGKVVKEKWGRALRTRTEVLFGSWNAALRAAGIEPIKENSPWRHADKAALLAEIRRRARAGESLQTTKVERSKWGTPLMNRVKTLFGSWTAALLEAGVDLPVGLTSPWRHADKTMIVAEIRRLRHAGQPLSYGEVEKQMWGPALLRRSKALFGSWPEAVRASRGRAQNNDK
jgi:hypothetical protein